MKISRVNGKPVVSVDQIVAAVKEGDYVGFCVHCGAERYEVEPDAREYPCEECGKDTVYGAEELLMVLA